MMWGTTSPSTKLTGDSGNAFEALLIGDCRFVSFFGGKLAAAPLELLQQNLPKPEIALGLPNRLPDLSGGARIG
jgi:hypothetical protein